MPKDDPAAPPVTAAGIRDALLAVAASFDILNA